MKLFPEYSKKIKVLPNTIGAGSSSRDIVEYHIELSTRVRLKRNKKYYTMLISNDFMFLDDGRSITDILKAIDFFYANFIIDCYKAIHLFKMNKESLSLKNKYGEYYIKEHSFPYSEEIRLYMSTQIKQGSIRELTED